MGQSKPPKFTGRKILLTGASRGLGKSLLDAFLNAGAEHIYATSRMPDRPTTNDSRVTWLALDLADTTSIEALSVLASDITILVNNAAVNHFGDALDTEITKMEHEIDVNYLGTLKVIRQLTPVIETMGGGSIININSICAFAGMPGVAGFSASKAALFSISQSLEPLLRQKNIRLQTVFPGPIDTDMNEGREIPDITSPERIAEEVINSIGRDEKNIFPDPTSRQVYQDWLTDPRMVEQEFSSY